MKTGEIIIDMGKVLSSYIKKNRISKTVLGRAINREAQSITKYEYNSSIQSGILVEICYALKHNFFQDIANRMPAEFSVDPELSGGDRKLIAELREENKVLRIQNELLMRIRS